MKLIRTFRTMTSERFLVQKKEGEDSAAIDLHYLADGHVAGTVFLFEHAGIEDAQVPEFLRHIDEALLPWVHFEDRTLTFTVVRGQWWVTSTPTRAKTSMEHDDGTSDLAKLVVKTYARQGEMQLVRLAVASEFHCSRCDTTKKAKLVAVVSGDWNRLLCNGCYGELLSGG